MTKDLFAFVILFGVVALATGNDAIGSSDLEDAPRLGETKSTYYSNTGYNGGYGDRTGNNNEYKYDRELCLTCYEDCARRRGTDDPSCMKLCDCVEEETIVYPGNLPCHMCGQICAGRGAADYRCDTNSCQCIPAKQTASNPNTYGPQKLSGNSCRGYFLQIGGRGLESTCEAFCKTIGRGKLIGVCIYNECTCEAMNQNDYPNGYSGHQQYNRYYRSVELSNDTLNVV